MQSFQFGTEPGEQGPLTNDRFDWSLVKLMLLPLNPESVSTVTPVPEPSRIAEMQSFQFGTEPGEQGPLTNDRLDWSLVKLMLLPLNPESV